MASETLYAGPAKLYRGTIGYFPEGEGGESKFEINQEKIAVNSAMHGRLRYNQGDATGEITHKPTDNWKNMAGIFLPEFGAKVGATPAALSIGKKLAGLGTVVPTKLWVPGDARMYTAVCTYIASLPQLHLGNGKALFDTFKIGCIGDPDKSLGDADFLYTITESAAADPGGVMAMDDFIQEIWTAAWGEDYTAMQAEEEFVVVPEYKVNVYKVQKLSRLVKLASVSYMVKGRLVGPTHTEIDAAIGINGGRLLGSAFGAEGTDLVLTSQSGKTITLKNADAVGAGFEFGGTKLGTGEVGFVNALTLTNGTPDALIEFSA
ncbi:MAG: hypothetical protein ABFD89_05180 [Bryobacteraceae bacterium]